MQKGHMLQFNCISCQNSVPLSIFELDQSSVLIKCSKCSKQYNFDDKDLLRQLRLFEALCRQVQASEEILGDCNVGIDVGGRQVKVPYKILLTRFNSSLELEMDEKSISIEFRLEPIHDLSPETDF